MQYEILQTETYSRWEAGLRDHKARALISARLTRLSHGLLGDVQPVGEGISELRIHYGPGYRIYFQRRGKTIVILLCGGAKDDQVRDIGRAKDLAKETE